MKKNGLFVTVFIAGLAASAPVRAQSSGINEAVLPDGSVKQNLTLTPAQERAIYNDVIGQRIRASATGFPTGLGAPVPDTAELHELPLQNPGEMPNDSMSLKYTVVDGAIVVVDPVRMCVIDVIPNDGGTP